MVVHVAGGGGGRKLGDSSALSPGTGKGMDDTDDNAVTESTESGTAHSLQCDECGKKLRDATAAQHHAERTQHTQFSESTDVIKPLSAEEKAEKLKLIQERLAAKRAAREALYLSCTVVLGTCIIVPDAWSSASEFPVHSFAAASFPYVCVPIAGLVA